MSKEEIRKLLGGYATNTLTESERNALFEAALDDQELFNALQQEQGLKNLLNDPVTRAQVRQALEAQPSKQSWRMRWLAWGGATGAAIAASVLFVVIRQNQVAVNKQSAQVAMARKAPSPMASLETREDKAEPNPVPKKVPPSPTPGAPGPALLRDSPTVATAAAPGAAPPPIIPAPVQSQTGQPSRQQEQDALLASPAQNSVAIAPSAKSITGSLEPVLRYSLLRREGGTFAAATDADLRPGDLVRLNVSATQPGQVVLSRMDETNNWQRVAEITVSANAGYTIPEAPIQVTATAQRYRLTLQAAAAQPQSLGTLAGKSKRAMRAASAAQAGAQATQSRASETAVVEITIRGN